MLERIRALEIEKDKLTENVASLRRTAPQRAAQNFKDKWASEVETFEQDIKQGDEAAQNASGEVDIGELKRWDEVQATWGRGTEGLVGLKGGLTETVAKLERANAVAEHMEKR
jgi:kinetochor protein Mis14/NSL1